MLHNNFFGMGPVLDGKMLNINVATRLNRDKVVDHIDSRHVVFVKWSGTMLWVFNIKKDSTKIFSVLDPETAARNSASMLNVSVVD